MKQSTDAKSGPFRRGSDSKGQLARAADRRKRALELRIKGVQYPLIAQALGCSKQNAFRLVQTALRELIRLSTEDAALLKQMEADRLDALQAAIWDTALAGNYAAIDRVVKLMERRAKLFGLDAPVKGALTTAAGEDVEAAIIWLPAKAPSPEAWARDVAARTLEGGDGHAGGVAPAGEATPAD